MYSTHRHNEYANKGLKCGYIRSLSYTYTNSRNIKLSTTLPYPPSNLPHLSKYKWVWQKAIKFIIHIEEGSKWKVLHHLQLYKLYNGITPKLVPTKVSHFHLSKKNPKTLRRVLHDAIHNYIPTRNIKSSFSYHPVLFSLLNFFIFLFF